MNVEIGVFSLGEMVPDPLTGNRPDSRQRLRDIIEQAEAAERAGLGVMGIGENHGTDVVAASPVVLLSAIAGRTRLLRLTTAVSVLTAGDPVQLYEQITMLDNISGGRAEMIVGRGGAMRAPSAPDPDGQDHDVLFEQNLLRLLQVVEAGPAAAEDPLGRGGRDLDIAPRPLQPRMPLWVGSSGAVRSVVRAAVLGLPLALLRTHGPFAGALPAVAAYRRALGEFGQDTRTPVSLNVPGFVARTPERARGLSHPYFAAGARSLGSIRPEDPRWSREEYERECGPEGVLVVGDVDEVVAKVVAQQQALGYGRLLVRLDAGGVPHHLVLESIRLLGTEVVPRVRAALA